MAWCTDPLNMGKKMMCLEWSSDFRQSFLSPVPGPPDSNQHGLVSAPWFTNEPILCSMMPVSIRKKLSVVMDC